MGEHGRDVVIRGVVVASDWEDDDPTALVIQTRDEREVAVAPGDLGEDLFDYLREEVEIQGRLRKTEGGREEIVVESYKILNWEED